MAAAAAVSVPAAVEAAQAERAGAAPARAAALAAVPAAPADREVAAAVASARPDIGEPNGGGGGPGYLGQRPIAAAAAAPNPPPNGAAPVAPAGDDMPSTGALRDASAAVRGAEASMLDALAMLGGPALHRDFVQLLD